MVFNGAQFHLIMNHLPVVGFLGLVPALLFAVLTSSVDIKRFILMVTVIVGLSSLAAYWTGEPAEEVVEHLPGIEEKVIHEHEEAAEFATILALVTAVAAAGALGLHYRRPETLRKTLPAVFVLSLAAAITMGKTAHEGGKIRHPEIRAGFEASKE